MADKIAMRSLVLSKTLPRIGGENLFSNRFENQFEKLFRNEGAYHRHRKSKIDCLMFYEESVVDKFKSNLLLPIFWLNIINYNS
jgi:hypothetical protein